MTLTEHIERVERALRAVDEAKRPADRAVRLKRAVRLYIAFGEALEEAESWLNATFTSDGIRWCAPSSNTCATPTSNGAAGSFGCLRPPGDECTSDVWLMGLSRYEAGRRALARMDRAIIEQMERMTP